MRKVYLATVDRYRQVEMSFDGKQWGIEVVTAAIPQDELRLMGRSRVLGLPGLSEEILISSHQHASQVGCPIVNDLYRVAVREYGPMPPETSSSWSHSTQGANRRSRGR